MFWKKELRLTYDATATPIGGEIALRFLRRNDEFRLRSVRSVNYEWLRPWEASLPPEAHRFQSGSVFGGYYGEIKRAIRRGEMLPFVIELDGHIVGQVTVFAIQYGSAMQGSIGYWVSQLVAGRGVAPTALALAMDYCFREMDLHRIEVCIRPENKASLRVVEKLGLTLEGLRQRYINVAGQWCDHLAFVQYSDDAPQGVLQRWLQRRGIEAHKNN